MTDSAVTNRPISVGTKVAYGTGAIAEASVHIVFITFNFLFYNNVLGLSGTLTGLAVTIAVIFDAVFDPVMGSISDRWHSKLGRRHPFLYVSAIPLGFCFFAIYSPPEGMDQIGLFLWFTIFTIGLRVALTFYQVPHLALGAELSEDYKERSVIYAYNAVFMVVGGSTAFFASWTWFGIAEGGTDNADNYLLIGVFVAVLASSAVLISAWFTRDQIPYLKKISDDLPSFSVKQLVADIWHCFQNPNYVWLLLGLVCISATSGVREAMGGYINLFFWELEPNQIRYIALASPFGFILAFFITPRLNERYEKVRTIVGGVTILAVAAIIPQSLRLLGLLPDNGHWLIFPLLLTFIAIYYGSFAVLNISVMSALADVADEHELRTGRRQEGIFYSARTFVGKCTSAFGLLIGGVAIDLINWPTKVTSADQVDPSIIFNLGLIEGPIAAIPSLIAIYFYGRYNINKARYLEIQAELKTRSANV